MARLPVVAYEKADKKIRGIYDAIQSKFGMVPSIFKKMVNISLVLEGYLKLDEIIAAGTGNMIMPSGANHLSMASVWGIK